MNQVGCCSYRWSYRGVLGHDGVCSYAGLVGGL